MAPLRYSLTKLPIEAILTLTAAWALPFACGSLRAEENSLRAALESISAGELQDHIHFLADDTLEGREAGSRGGRAAAGYLATLFEKAGLRPLGEKTSYYQPFGNEMRNVLGVLEGSDPELKQQYVLIGAHYDHVGYGNRRTSLGPYGFVHNGADDNASGTSALLELIDAFNRLPQPPKRSILFACWDGEEQGLLGSKHWVANPSIPLQQIVFAFNIDMIGRLRDQKVEVFGTRSSQGLRQLLSRHNAEFGLELDFSWEMQANSDHHTFYAKSIPVLMLFTGLHDDYHRPGDDSDKVNAPGAEAVTRLLFSTAHEIAQRSDAISFRAGSRNESPATRQQFEKSVPPSGPRLGMSWEQNGERLAVRSVQRGSAAERIGLRTGDQLIAINGQPIANDDQLRIDILAARNPLAITVARDGQPDPVELRGDLDGQPVRLGIAWREVDAEPGTLMVVQVIPGSAAHLAGIREFDRIYAVGGQAFRNGEEFFRRINTLPAPLDLTIERRGRIVQFQVAVPPLPQVD